MAKRKWYTFEPSCGFRVSPFNHRDNIIKIELTFLSSQDKPSSYCVVVEGPTRYAKRFDTRAGSKLYSKRNAKVLRALLKYYEDVIAGFHKLALRKK